MAQKGFTLIELLVVLLIISVMLALGNVAFQRAIPGLELKSSARMVAAVLRDARGRAIARNREAAVVVDTELRTYRLAGDPRVGLFRDGIMVSILTTQSEFVDDGVGRIRFFPDGSSTGGRVTLFSERRSYHVLVDWLTGRVAIKD